nr:hypothetical protein Q903MT_gene764 [Picea sitchensis]
MELSLGGKQLARFKPEQGGKGPHFLTLISLGERGPGSKGQGLTLPLAHNMYLCKFWFGLTQGSS